MQRLISFARSVIPADAAQLFLLVGSVLLLICAQLRCYPTIPEAKFVFGEFYPGSINQAWQWWLTFTIAARLPIVFAGGAGFFVCFRPGPRPLVRILGFVLIPAILGELAIFGRYLYMLALANFPQS